MTTRTGLSGTPWANGPNGTWEDNYPDIGSLAKATSGDSTKALYGDGSFKVPGAYAAINTQTASYQITLNDSGSVVEMDVAGANNLTVPSNATIAFPIGSCVDVVQLGAGQTTIVAADGVTIRSAGGVFTIASQYSGATLYKRGTDEWVLVQ